MAACIAINKNLDSHHRQSYGGLHQVSPERHFAGRTGSRCWDDSHSGAAPATV